MNYCEVSMVFNDQWLPGHIEVLAAYMADNGFESFLDIEKGFSAYIPADHYNPEIFKELPGELSRLPKPLINVSEIPDCNWNEVWESNFNPVIIADKLSVRASFHPVPDNVIYDIVINPKMSFGTGHHETTSLVSQLLLEMNCAGQTVLDMGCGTGILAILAKMKDAKEVWAIDNDEWAYNNSVENCSANDCADIKVLLGDADDIPAIEFDLIIANINRNILLNDMKKYTSCLKQTGKVILSGFFQEDISPVKAEAESLGLEFTGFINDGKWVACSFINTGKIR